MRLRDLAPLFALAWALSACGSSGDLTPARQDAGPSDALSACYEQCAQRATAKDCTAGGTDEDQCRGGCDTLVPGLAEDCQTKAVAAYDCAAHATWACSVDGAPQIQDGACQSENDAYAPCFR